MADHETRRTRTRQRFFDLLLTQIAPSHNVVILAKAEIQNAQAQIALPSSGRNTQKP